jgi:hypothetical protein
MMFDLLLFSVSELASAERLFPLSGFVLINKNALYSASCRIKDEIKFRGTTFIMPFIAHMLPCLEKPDSTLMLSTLVRLSLKTASLHQSLTRTIRGILLFGVSAPA